MIRRVLFIILLILAFIAPGAAEARCTYGNMCWERGGPHSNRWNGGSRYYGDGYRHQDRVIVVPVERRDPNIRVEREPGIIDVPLGILDFGLGLVFGRTKLVDTSCADDDVSCHAAKGREDGRHAGKSAVADATESDEYRAAYDDAIRNSGRTVEPAAELRETDVEPEE